MGLGDVTFRLIQRWRGRGSSTLTIDGVPLPPPYLRVLTAGSAHIESFVRIGIAAADGVQALAAQHDVALTDVLEFGVGCGRVARWLQPNVDRFHGCDINEELVTWSQANLSGDYIVNSQTPPLPYDDAAFRVVYALSVFTHMHESSACAWLRELARVTRPGGVAILSFFDARSPGAQEAADQLARDGFAIRQEGAEGSNLLCSHFTNEGFAARAAPEWRLETVIPHDMTAVGQSWAVFRRV